MRVGATSRGAGYHVNGDQYGSRRRGAAHEEGRFVLATRRSGKARLSSLLTLLAVAGVIGIAGCDSGSDGAATPTPTTSSPTPLPSTTRPAPPSSLAPTTAGPVDPEALEVSGRASPGATIEATFESGHDAITAQADADGQYSFAVSDLP